VGVSATVGVSSGALTVVVEVGSAGAALGRLQAESISAATKNTINRRLCFMSDLLQEMKE
jgi:hypothetical protein